MAQSKINASLRARKPGILHGNVKPGVQKVETAPKKSENLKRKAVGAPAKAHPGVSAALTEISANQKSASLTFHREGVSDAEKVLRNFDLTYDYGPCVGISRQERYERAVALGLEPPSLVGRLLGAGEVQQCVFTGL